jgi:hypothetical protein
MAAPENPPLAAVAPMASIASPPPLPVQPVLSYAPPTLLEPSRATVFIVRALAAVQLLAGGGGLVSFMSSLFSYGQMPLFLTVAILVATMAHLLIGVALLMPRPGAWRCARLTMGILLLPALGFIGFGVVMFVLYHEKKGWDQLGAVVGAAIAIIASAPFWLNLLTLWYLMRPRSRAMFGVSPVETFAARKTFMRVTLVLWVGALMTCLIAWIV